MFGWEIIHFKRPLLSENINEYNPINDCDDSMKAVDHRNTISPSIKLNIWAFYWLQWKKILFELEISMTMARLQYVVDEPIHVHVLSTLHAFDSDRNEKAIVVY